MSALIMGKEERGFKITKPLYRGSQSNCNVKKKSRPSRCKIVSNLADIYVCENFVVVALGTKMVAMRPSNDILSRC